MLRKTLLLVENPPDVQELECGVGLGTVICPTEELKTVHMSVIFSSDTLCTTCLGLVSSFLGR